MSRKRSTKAPQPISGQIEKVLGKLGLRQSFRGWQVVTHWPEIVGEQIAAKSQAVRFSEGVLYVAVEDAAWRQELAMQVDGILKIIHERPFGRAVTQIRLTKGDKRIDKNGDTGP